MTQSEVIKLLQKEKKWMTAREINSKLKFTSANSNLCRLFKGSEILKREIKKPGEVLRVEWKIK